MNKYFDIYIENPLKTYNKIKKYFKPIKPEFQIYFGRRNSAKIVELNIFDLTWKDKWNSPRHEFNPRLMFSLFNIIHIYIEWTLKQDSMDDMVYWEIALNWLYYGKDLAKAIKLSSGWSQYNEDTDSYELIRFEVLKPKYQQLYNNNELPKIMYEGNSKN
jgi:hypothetical protein